MTVSANPSFCSFSIARPASWSLFSARHLRFIQLARRNAPAHPPPSLPARASQIHECPIRDLYIPSVAVYFNDQNEMMAPKSSGLYAFLARTK